MTTLPAYVSLDEFTLAHPVLVYSSRVVGSLGPATMYQWMVYDDAVDVSARGLTYGILGGDGYQLVGADGASLVFA